MQEQWVRRNVDLALLSECVETFFNDRGFKTVKEFSADEYTIIWGPLFRGSRRLRVKIIGVPNDFRIEFLGGEEARRSILLGYVTTLFGGGGLVREGLRLKDALEKVENEFWAYMEREVERLARLGRSQ